MPTSAYSIGPTAVQNLFPKRSRDWKLLRGHEIETRHGKRLPILAVELAGDDGPLFLVKPSHTAHSEQFGLADFDANGWFVRLWIDASRNPNLVPRTRNPTGVISTTEAEFRLLSQALKNQHVEHVDHITDIRNIASILTGGFHARNFLRSDFVDLADPEVNDRRKRHDPIYSCSLHDYVPFYFNSVNAMLSKRREMIEPSLVIIKVAAEAIVHSDKRWLISDGNAASAKTQFFDRIDGLRKLDWECLRAKYWKDEKRPDNTRTRMAELLVEAAVPAHWIVRIDCFSDDTMWALREIAENLGLRGVELGYDSNPFGESGYDSNPF